METESAQTIRVVTGIEKVSGKIKVEFSEITLPSEATIRKVEPRFFEVTDKGGKLRVR